MNRVVKQYEGKEIHVILDNLSTHKPKRDLWLARHPNVHFHYTPTHTSWLNQIEIWFSILAAPVVEGGLVRQRRRTGGSHRKLHQQLQRGCPPLCLDQKRRPPKAPKAMFRGSVILGYRVLLRTFGGTKPHIVALLDGAARLRRKSR